MSENFRELAETIIAQLYPEVDESGIPYLPHIESVETIERILLSSEPLQKLVENAFSWGKQDCNYLNPKHIDAFIAATQNGMTPEAAAVWIADGTMASARTPIPEVGWKLVPVVADRATIERRFDTRDWEASDYRDAGEQYEKWVAAAPAADVTQFRAMIDKALESGR